MPTHKPSQDPTLTLKSMPPRAVKGFLNRERLHLSQFNQSEQITALCAPTGYGKTSQLSQWRRDALASGALAFWYTVDERDEPKRFVRGLSCSAKMSCGKRGFDEAVIEWIEDRSNSRDALAGWLAEVANLSVDVTLFLDDVDLFPTSCLNQVITYLLGNAPSNLHICLTSRNPGIVSAISAHRPGAVTRLLTADLCFRLEETLLVLSSILGKTCSPELGVRVLELTEGWPLGVKLAAVSLSRGDDVESLPPSALADIQGYFVETVINRLSDQHLKRLIQLSQFDLIHPELCSEVLGFDLKGDDIRSLQDNVPLLLSVEGQEWISLHPLAKGVLQKHIEEIPITERQAVAKKASKWYENRELYEEASKYSLLAGDTNRAINLVENSTEQMTIQGRSSAVLAWFERMSPEEQLQHPKFWSSAAWALAMSERHAEAQPLIDLILAQEDLDELSKFDAALISSAAAGFADRIDLVESSIKPWPYPYSNGSPSSMPVHANSCALVALFKGQPDQARNILTRIEGYSYPDAYSPVAFGYSVYGTALSYLWEGRVALAEEILRPALADLEKELGRRHPVTCTIAALLAQACWELGLDDDPRVLLADRLPVLEHLSLPDTLIAAYRTLASFAYFHDRQDIALSLLDSLLVIGKQRSIIRIQVVAKFEQIRIHAQSGRIDSARALNEELKELVKYSPETQVEPISKLITMFTSLAETIVILAQDDLQPLSLAIESVNEAISIAKKLKRTAALVAAQLLRAEVLSRTGDPKAQSIKEEAISLGRAEKMVRLLRDLSGEASTLETTVAKPDLTIGENKKIDDFTNDSALLTPKEQEVLSLLSLNFSNKEIARAMDISVETVKWHLKNLFSKLDAANRKHVVAKARMLGHI